MASEDRRGKNLPLYPLHPTPSCPFLLVGTLCSSLKNAGTGLRMHSCSFWKASRCCLERPLPEITDISHCVKISVLGSRLLCVPFSGYLGIRRMSFPSGRNHLPEGHMAPFLVQGQVVLSNALSRVRAVFSWHLIQVYQLPFATVVS